MNESEVITSVRRWVESVVVGFNLCPFAKRELVKDRVRFAMTAAENEQGLLTALHDELRFLQSHAEVETAVLIHPGVLQCFDDYNQFLNEADALIAGMQLEGVIQVASFHPDYQFGGTSVDDAENYTNRSPYPLLHLLREESLERVIDETLDVDQIPVRNIERMRQIGQPELERLLQSFLP